MLQQPACSHYFQALVVQCESLDHISSSLAAKQRRDILLL
jgi:hypothetical protein